MVLCEEENIVAARADDNVKSSEYSNENTCSAKNETSDNKHTWARLAIVLDRLLFYIFFLIYGVIFVIVFIVIPIMQGYRLPYYGYNA